MNQRISVIMPAYNEGQHIFENIRMTHEVMRKTGMTTEIVVVDDGSNDNTLNEIERAARTFDNVAVVHNPYNMGKGMALRTGFDYSCGEIVVFLDADLDLHPSQIKGLIGVLEMGSYDVVVTSKHHPDSQLDYPRSRKVTSWLYYMAIKILFSLPVRDTQTGLKVFRREVLQNVFHRLLVKKFAYDVELLATAVRLGYSIYEIPVVLNFKRELKWGRISTEDILNIIVDTLAIFYRLRILRYYDRERPPIPKEEKPVLVVVRGCPPAEEVIKRLSIYTNTRIACISTHSTDNEQHEGILCFSDIDHLNSWIMSEGNTIQIIGFIGAGFLPVGSWIRNAVRNFEDPEVEAVCGPLLPGPFANRLEQAACNLASSSISTGPLSYLYSLKPVNAVTKGFMDNVFVRAVVLSENKPDRKLSIENDIIYAKASDGVLRYDPDVAVSKPAPSLFLPYMKAVALDAFLKGHGFSSLKITRERLWAMAPVLVWLMVLAGWIVIPLPAYYVLCAVYLTIIIMAGLMCFDLRSTFLFVIGMLLEHLVRAFAFSAGILKWILGIKRK